jgi:hypothetical protein
VGAGTAKVAPSARYPFPPPDAAVVVVVDGLVVVVVEGRVVVVDGLVVVVVDAPVVLVVAGSVVSVVVGPVTTEPVPGVAGRSAGLGNGHESSPSVAFAMYLRQIWVGNEPPVTDVPCTDFMYRVLPSGLASG